jgi:hypothetical protein
MKGGDTEFKYAELRFEETKRTAGCLFVPKAYLSDPSGALAVLKAMLVCFDNLQKPNMVVSCHGQRYVPTPEMPDLETMEPSEPPKLQPPLQPPNLRPPGSPATSYLEWFDEIQDNHATKKAWGWDKRSRFRKNLLKKMPKEEAKEKQRQEFAESLVGFSATLCKSLFDCRTACVVISLHIVVSTLRDDNALMLTHRTCLTVLSGKGAAWLMTGADRSSCSQLLGDGLAKCGPTEHTWIGQIHGKTEARYGTVVSQLLSSSNIFDKDATRKPKVSYQVVYPDFREFYPSGEGNEVWEHGSLEGLIRHHRPHREACQKDLEEARLNPYCTAFLVFEPGAWAAGHLRKK